MVILGTICSMKARSKTRLSILALSALILFGSASSALAQVDFNFDGSGTDEEEEAPRVLNPYDDKYKPDIEQPAGDSTSILPNFYYYAGFVRKPGASADDLNMVIFSPASITGCLDIENPSIKTVKAGNTMRLKIIDGSIDVDRDTVRYFHYECSPQSGTSQMSMTFSKNQLREDGIEKFVVESEAIGPFSDMLLDIKETHVTIEATVRDLSRMGLPVPVGASAIQTFWNYPENTMVVFSTSADLNDAETMAQAKSAVRKKGLSLLEDVLPGFRPDAKNANKLYVVDTAGRFAEELAERDAVFEIGSIKEKELYFGANGPYDKSIKKSIFAKRPGLYE